MPPRNPLGLPRPVRTHSYRPSQQMSSFGQGRAGPSLEPADHGPWTHPGCPWDILLPAHRVWHCPSRQGQARALCSPPVPSGRPEATCSVIRVVPQFVEGEGDRPYGGFRRPAVAMGCSPDFRGSLSFTYPILLAHQRSVWETVSVPGSLAACHVPRRRGGGAPAGARVAGLWVQLHGAGGGPRGGPACLPRCEQGRSSPRPAPPESRPPFPRGWLDDRTQDGVGVSHGQGHRSPRRAVGT